MINLERPGFFKNILGRFVWNTFRIYKYKQRVTRAFGSPFISSNWYNEPRFRIFFYVSFTVFKATQHAASEGYILIFPHFLSLLRLLCITPYVPFFILHNYKLCLVVSFVLHWNKNTRAFLSLARTRLDKENHREMAVVLPDHNKEDSFI